MGYLNAKKIRDPGASGVIDVRRDGVCAMTSAGAETRSLPRPLAIGQRLELILDTDGGDVVVTSTGTVNVTGNNTLTFDTAGDHISLVGCTVAGALVWRVVGGTGVALSTV